MSFILSNKSDNGEIASRLAPVSVTSPDGPYAARPAAGGPRHVQKTSAIAGFHGAPGRNAPPTRRIEDGEDRSK